MEPKLKLLQENRNEGEQKWGVAKKAVAAGANPASEMKGRHLSNKYENSTKHQGSKDFIFEKNKRT